MTEDQAALFRQHTGRRALPASPAREGWLVVGQRGGKSRIAALVAVFFACLRDYRAALAPGERAVVMVLAADRERAKVVLGYIAGLIGTVPMLAPLVASRTAGAIHLTNRVSIEIHTASYRAMRGRTVVAAICDELAFWRSEDSAYPDTEVLTALRPAMATVRDPLLLCIYRPPPWWTRRRGQCGTRLRGLRRSARAGALPQPGADLCGLAPRGSHLRVGVAVVAGR